MDTEFQPPLVEELDDGQDLLEEESKPQKTTTAHGKEKPKAKPIPPRTKLINYLIDKKYIGIIAHEHTFYHFHSLSLACHAEDGRKIGSYQPESTNGRGDSLAISLSYHQLTLML
jgi:hypothetical protein